MKSKLDTIVTVTLLACALVTTGLVVRKELAKPPDTASRTEQKPILLENWQSYLAKGFRMGPAEAPIQLIELADFECPFCATFHATLKVLRERYPTQIALTYVHFPLSTHRFAQPAARVVECAGEQGRFEAMYDVLFEHQKEFGLRPWAEFAVQAGVPDGAMFDTCIKRTEPLTRVVEGQALGEQLNIAGTPTIIVNGWKLARPPSLDELDAMVKAILAGVSPLIVSTEK
jgi:protein-disulfide isomerase